MVSQVVSYKTSVHIIYSLREDLTSQISLLGYNNLDQSQYLFFLTRVFLDDDLISISNYLRSLSMILPISLELAFEQYF